jgi:hypothetical protein
MATTAKHTPGPWQIIPPRIGAALTIYAPDGLTPICTTASNTSPVTMEMHRSGEVRANARLIAAAPDLLGALETMVERFKGHAWGSEEDEERAITKACAAIAKATGAP